MQDNPFEAPVASAPPSPAAEAAEPAGFWWRALASLLDAVIVGMPLGIVMLVNTLLWHVRAIELAMIPAFALYRVALDTSGGTVGKRLLRMRLVDAAGRRPGLPRALLRNVHLLVIDLAMMAARAATTPAATRHDPTRVHLDSAQIVVMALSSFSTALWLVIVVFVAARADRRGLHDLWSGVWCLRLGDASR